MSDSYEIIDDGPCIRIVSPDSTISTIVGRPVGYHIDDAVIGAIRQQARDLDQLRADLAAAVAERDGLGYYRAEFEPIWDGLQDALEGERQIDSYGLGESEVECVRRVLRERDQLRGELAAAVAERSEYWGALHSTRDELFECRANQRTLESDLRITRDQRDTLRTSIEDPGIGWRVSLQRWRQRAEQAEARLAALAELERAAAEPVAWMWEDMLGISHTYVSSKRPTWPDAGASPEMEMAINVRPLYAAPPAPVAEIRKVVVTDEMALRISEKYHGIQFESDFSVRLGRDMISAVRAELGPTLSLVELKEPTPEECADMAEWFKSECAACCINPQESADYGRAIFDAVKIVLWPKEGL